MLWQYNPYSFVMFVSAGISASLVLYIWRRRGTSLVSGFVLFLLAIGEWSLALGVELMCADLPSVVLWDQVSYVGIVSAPLAWMIFVLQHTGRKDRLNRPNVLLASIVPTVTLLLDWTNQAHHLIYETLGLVRYDSWLVLKVTWGPWFDLFVAYCYTMIVLGAILLVQYSARSHYRDLWQMVALVLSVSLPLTASVIDVAEFTPIEITPLACTFSGLIIFLAVFRFRLFEIARIARETVFREIADPVIVLDHDEHLVDLNSAAERMISCPAEKARGQHVNELLKSDGMNGHALTEQFSELVLIGNGSSHSFDVRRSPLYDPPGELAGFVSIFHDITQRKIMEARLSEAQRLAAIGQTTAMIGHDLRNPLQAAAAAIYLLEKLLNSSNVSDLHEARDLLSTLDDQVRYMEGTVSDLQDYSRPLKVESLKVDLLDLIRNTLAAVEYPEGVETSIVVQEDLSHISLDATLLKRILTNLTTNAIQAMPHGGKLTITGSKNTDTVTVSVRDTGVGIVRQNVEKIFNPFFTTKARGLGLGLAVCKRLVEAMGGTITMSSEVGEGTCFTIILPTRPDGVASG